MRPKATLDYGRDGRRSRYALAWTVGFGVTIAVNSVQIAMQQTVLKSDHVSYGLPFTYFEEGGYVYTRSFEIWALAGDLFVAFLCGCAVVLIVRFVPRVNRY